MSGNLETRSIFDELRSFDTGGYFDLGHPLLNRIAHSFIKAAGVPNTLSFCVCLSVYVFDHLSFKLIFFFFLNLKDRSGSGSFA